MDLWVSYGITKARYDVGGSKVLKVEIHRIEHGVMSPRRVWPKGNVVHLIKNGIPISTIHTEANGDFHILENLRLVRRGGRSFLRVDDDPASRDDLGKIPNM